ncbi:uncharacterized protein MELLADRAFT_85587 [Melampsora larici-populina 98AG31]|uniref:Uncharacterized protein n=1 Tax=Melampsora larici-populina (strain 98AG31 / pathotype 3-4-7) TaxID=747676 RepID=F4SD72_MELLP|nr:uncharacterized protein MELLADRAFT_85587 [Melampsora larici-populina 98AG31]EGF97405.1 hypothetical protein MELLADRAFT_85587 [Melampsora larici-populina 98AG31]
MSSQTNRTQPYSLTTPRGGMTNTGLGSHSGSRAEQRSVRGQGSTRASTIDVNREGSDLSTEQIMAAIASLGAKLEKEILVLSDNLKQDISTISVKIDKDISSLSNQMEEDMNSMADQIERNLTTISNKLDQVDETVGGLTDRHAGNHAPAAGTPSTGPSGPTPPWTYSAELKERVYNFAYESVAEPNIASYTKLEDPNGNLIVHSLFNTIKQKIKNIPGTWSTEQLPPVVNGAQSVAAIQTYTTLLKDAGKHARERLHNLVLHNIKNNPEATVPSIKKLLHRIARQCGNSADGLDEEAYWLRAPEALRLRITYLRREAIRIFQSRRAGGGGGNIWARVDKQLHLLSDEEPLYASAFYNLIYDQDCATFDSKGYFANIDVNATFDLPLEEEIHEEMERLLQEGATGMQG